MATDVLSDVLSAVHLTGAVFFHIDLSSPWVLEAPPSRDIASIGIGVEAMSLGTLDTVAANSRTFKQTDYEQESVVVATAHARVIAEGRVALEIVGGLGQLRSHRTFRTTHPTSPAPATVFTEDSTMRALMTGIDMPIHALPHVTVGPSARMYFLRRPHHSSGGLNSRDSAIFMFGVIADVIW